MMTGGRRVASGSGGPRDRSRIASVGLGADSDKAPVASVTSGGKGRLGAVSVRGGDLDPDAGLARCGVPEIQRARIIAALVEVARERGAGRVTVAHIVVRSGVSRRTFYELFEDREACFLAAFEDAVERAATLALPAFEGADGWCNRVRAGLAALLEFLDDEPGLGGLGIVDALSAGATVLERRAQVLQALVDVVDGGRAEAKAGLRPTRLTAEGVVGGVLSVLYARLAERGPSSERPQRMLSLLNPLMGVITLPYMGPAAAGREATRPVPRMRLRTRRRHSNPLAGLEMRLTYRTMRVLMAIASEPGASNRQVADAAGVSDQGQISKLLARLEHLGLATNSSAGPVRGEPNAWRLTPRGQQVERAIRE
jgi:AcrR family transcriptional regulator/DNA-binding MarR family transcriptional regulator